MWTQHSEVSGFGLVRTQSPPPAHQQASPITPVNSYFDQETEAFILFYERVFILIVHYLIYFLFKFE